MTENAIAKEIVDAAFRIHTALGPGLLESVYDAVLAYELGRRGLRTARQQPIPVVYENVRIDTGFRADLLRHSREVTRVCSPKVIHNLPQLAPEAGDDGEVPHIRRRGPCPRANLGGNVHRDEDNHFARRQNRRRG